ncbi:hypothetical protein JCM8097_008112 [Rhodosporidiobolus ruineniae]
MSTPSQATAPLDSFAGASTPSAALIKSASLSSLPPELKLKVVQQAQRIDSGVDDPFDCFIGEGNSVQPWMGVGGRSPTTLAALSLVSKEWHELCVPYLWQTLHVEEYNYEEDILREDPVLRKAIIPRYKQHVKELKFESDEAEGFGFSDEECFDPDELGERPCQPFFLTKSLTRLIYTFPNLETLNMTFRWPEDVPRFHKPLPIKRFRLYVYKGLSVDSTFLSPFSSTLEQLILENYKPSTGTCDFPRLKHLAVVFRDKLPHKLRKRLFVSPSSPLAHLYLNAIRPAALPDVLEILKAHPDTLRTFTLGARYMECGKGEKDAADGTIADIELWCRAHGVKVSMSKPVGRFYS